jgi:predicted dehydrogenase
MIKCGIIGYGKMGRIRANAVRADGRGEIIAVHDPYGKFEDDHDFDIKRDSNEVINDPDIEAVFICTPNFLNKSLTIRALEAGKHVFCEKPPAFTARDVEEIIEIEKKTNKKLMYGFNHRHHTSLKYMKSLVVSGEYGKILWIRGRYGKSVDKNFFNSWRAKKEFAGGGILLDQGIHMLDLFLYLGGKFDQVKADVSNRYWKLDIEDNVFAILKNTETGSVAQLHSTMTQWRHLFSLEVFLENGYMVLNGLKTSSNTYGNEVLSIAKNRSTTPAATWEDEERITYNTNTSWRSEIDHFFDAILNDIGITIGNSSDALNVMKTIEMIYSNGKS